MLALTALVTAALFTGAAFYVSFVEHPARMLLDDRNALAQWKPSYARGAIMQAGLALFSGAAGFAAWAGWRSVWPWAAGAVVILLIVAYTFAVIWKTNGQLKATPIDQAGPETRALLVKWGQLHLGRTILGAISLGFYVYGMT
jgi:hypothetical protein